MIGKYAAENSNASCIRHFQNEYRDLNEGTVRKYKKKYLDLLGKNPSMTVACR